MGEKRQGEKREKSDLEKKDKERGERREKFDLEERRRETRKEKKVIRNLWHLCPYRSKFGTVLFINAKCFNI